jgi:benzoyl-CoA-dihydrodiol lyase
MGSTADAPTPEQGARLVDYQTQVSRYAHWRLACEGPVATLTLDVKETGGLRPNFLLRGEYLHARAVLACLEGEFL